MSANVLGRGVRDPGTTDEVNMQRKGDNKKTLQSVSTSRPVAVATIK